MPKDSEKAVVNFPAVSLRKTMTLTVCLPALMRSARQPYGLLHGGVSVVLAETLGSCGAAYAAPEGHRCLSNRHPN